MSAADATSVDITDLILLQHAEFRTRFTKLSALHAEGNVIARAVSWRVLADLLEVHASAEEEILYPVLLKRGGDQAPAETLDAVGDHNQIRDAITQAARVASGTAFWWAAVQAERPTTSIWLRKSEM
jgi:iron-sulfur cluster repair protein YtfE (RIC family)